MKNPRLENYADNPGYVYLMASHDKVKIGKSGWPQDRAKNFRTGNPDIKLLDEWCVLDMPFVENALHKFFAADRIAETNEWFHLKEEASEFLRHLDDVALMSWVRDYSCCPLNEFKNTKHWKRMHDGTFLMFSIPKPDMILMTRFSGRKPTRLEMLELHKRDPEGMLRCSHAITSNKVEENLFLTLMRFQ